MRVITILNGQKTVVLLDTGSTHSFMDGTLAKTLKLPIDVESNFRVRDLSDMHKLSCFISDMKDEIRLAVKMQGARNLGEAYALAKIQEEY